MKWNRQALTLSVKGMLIKHFPLTFCICVACVYTPLPDSFHSFRIIPNAFEQGMQLNREVVLLTCPFGRQGLPQFSADCSRK